MHCTRSSIGCSSLQGICAPLTGGSRSSSVCSGMQGIYAQLTGDVYLPSIYMHFTRSSSGFSGVQGISAQLTGGLSLGVGVAVCKASMLD